MCIGQDRRHPGAAPPGTSGWSPQSAPGLLQAFEARRAARTTVAPASAEHGQTQCRGPPRRRSPWQPAHPGEIDPKRTAFLSREDTADGCVESVVATYNVAVTASKPGDSNNSVLRAYLDAVTLSEGLQTRLWQAAQLTPGPGSRLAPPGQGGKPLGQLGAELALSPPSVSRLADRLEERGPHRAGPGRRGPSQGDREAYSGGAIVGERGPPTA